MSILAKIRHFTRGEPLSCENVNRFLTDYLDGTMDERTRTRFEAHLRNCPNCERFLEQYRETVSLVRSETAIDVPDEVIDRTIDFLKNHADAEE